MSLSKKIHNNIGVVPFIAMATASGYIAIARLQLGYFPAYGSQPDPSAFGYMWLESLGFLLLLLSVPCSLIWLTATVYGIIERRFNISYISTALFIIGVSLFFVMQHFFGGIFEWYLD